MVLVLSRARHVDDGARRAHALLVHLVVSLLHRALEQLLPAWLACGVAWAMLVEVLDHLRLRLPRPELVHVAEKFLEALVQLLRLPTLCRRCGSLLLFDPGGQQQKAARLQLCHAAVRRGRPGAVGVRASLRCACRRRCYLWGTSGRLLGGWRVVHDWPDPTHHALCLRPAAAIGRRRRERRPALGNARQAQRLQGLVRDLVGLQEAGRALLGGPRASGCDRCQHRQQRHREPSRQLLQRLLLVLAVIVRLELRLRLWLEQLLLRLRLRLRTKLERMLRRLRRLRPHVPPFHRRLGS